jgi:hypothetical protein
MTFFDNLRQLYVLVPFIFLIKNKVGFFISLFYKSNFKIKIDNQLFHIPKSRFETLLYLLNWNFDILVHYPPHPKSFNID